MPVHSEIPGSIPYGKTLHEFGNAKQGIAFGKYQYKGPKPPKFIRNKHHCVFTVYVLDTLLDLASDSKRSDLVTAMQGHILQQASITGIYKNGKSPVK